MGAERPQAFYQGFPMLGRAQAQAWSYAPRYRRPRHFHDEPELNIIVAGTARFGIGCRVIEARAGEVLSFPAGQDHELLQGSSDLSFLAIGIKSGLCGDILRNQRVRVPLPMCLRPTADEFNRLVSGVSAVVGSAEHETRVAELWERVYSGGWGTTGHEGGELHVLTRRTLEALSVAPELGREELARHARANPSEISRWFHRDLGITLVHHRTRLRLLKFIRQVDWRSGDLTAAANEAGFGSYSQCHRAFQAEFDCSPRQFFFSGLREQHEQSFAPFIRCASVDA